jgi:uncharacterized membrane protein YfhO
MKNNDFSLLDEDNDDVDYPEFSKHLRSNIKISKINYANEIESIGNELNSEIERKRKNETAKKNKLIKYIVKKDKDKYTSDELGKYSLNDIRIIYNEVKSNHVNISDMIKFALGYD